jgi:hypothetical protein
MKVEYVSEDRRGEDGYMTFEDINLHLQGT